MMFRVHGRQQAAKNARVRRGRAWYRTIFSMDPSSLDKLSSRQVLGKLR